MPYSVKPYDEDIGDYILTGLANGKTLIGMMRDNPDVPDYGTINAWRRGEGGAPLEWDAHYANSRLDQSDHLADQIVDLADDETNQAHVKAMEAVERSRELGVKRLEVIYQAALREYLNKAKLRIDARKWTTARLQPRRWGDRLQLDHEGSVGVKAKVDLSKLSTEQLEQIQEIQKDVEENN